jgi:hypothetical protein
MTERDPPNRRPRQKTLELGSELAKLGHTPESFARVIGRNASGLRRAIRGETRMSPSMARDIIDGLYAEGWTGDPKRIVQLQKVFPGVTVESLGRRAGRGSAYPPSAPRALLYEALSDLMRYLGREEVDRLYRRVFGMRPNERNK